MSILIDANTFAAVFDSSNAEHQKFQAVKSWIDSGRGFLIYGGEKYKKEIIQGYHRARLIRLLRDAGKAFEIRADLVDLEEKRIKRKTKGTNCNDQHIIALLIIANCALLCSSDKTSFPHIKDKNLYPKKFPKVKIYTGPRNALLLSKKSSAAITNVA